MEGLLSSGKNHKTNQFNQVDSPIPWDPKTTKTCTQLLTFTMQISPPGCHKQVRRPIRPFPSPLVALRYVIPHEWRGGNFKVLEYLTVTRLQCFRSSRVVAVFVPLSDLIVFVPSTFNCTFTMATRTEHLSEYLSL